MDGSQLRFDPPSLLQAGIALFREGRLAEAERVLSQLLQQLPNCFDALHLLGIIARRTQRSELAVELITRAIGQNGAVPAAHRHLANALMDLGRTREAVASYDTAVRLKPSFLEAHVGRGFALLQRGRPQPALESFEQAIALPGKNLAAYHGRAASLIALKRTREALTYCDQGLALHPATVELHIDRAAALRELGLPKEALASCERAIALRSEAAQAFIVQGAAFADLNQFDHALRSFDRAISLQPDEPMAHNGRGSVLLDLQRPEEALASFERALALQPDFGNAHNNRGVALGQLMQSQAALSCFEKAMALEPDSHDYRLNAAHAHLQLGQLELGWPLYEWRPKRAGAIAAGDWPQPQWLGQENIAGRTLLVQAEQGLGDTIQFCRYLKCLEALGASVVLSVPAKLLRLLRRHNPTVHCVADSQAPPPFDYHCRLLSVPLALRTTLDTIPAAVPYLFAEPDRIALWRQRLGSEGFRIGVCWQGRVTRMDLGRSFPVAYLQAMSRIPGVRLISLQKGAGTEQLNRLPQDMVVEVPEEPFDDGPDAFVDTAAIMECLDLVITSDTSIAHLAGALGRTTWVALQYVPDWRWLLRRTDSPWYPQMRLFRQTERGNWSSVFDAMHEALLTDLQ